MTPPNNEGERLQKVLARAGVASRRQVEEMILEGRITVNGEVPPLGTRVDLEVDAVKVDGRRVQSTASVLRYLLINKPRGYVSTLSDPEERQTILELVPERLRKGLVPVGRLDYDSEGLMLLTNDGDFAHRVAHPRYGCGKTYEVKVKGRPTQVLLDRLRAGVVIDGKRTAPAHITLQEGEARGARESVSNSWWQVVLSEGRTRQIREMFFRIGHPVNRLRRVGIGPLRDGRLPMGSWRELSEKEVDILRKHTSKVRAKGRAPRGVPVSGSPGPRPGSGKLKPGGSRRGPGKSKSPGSSGRRSSSRRPGSGRGRKN